ncbi:carboxymuconolactone decarboxylase family protein [Amycolatopsis acidicola]|uniref:Carboxymuconolactone decarboxylase family protein n=1 Tax=Amycolatopsis acidicola TaxID=2596893 RepID=A0A5N0UYM4_9PSEU|nr:carboxymuconolactone decarboxylase family protein [Amycolatopsis acidicola]KAA9156537.1 carboxymuconolactone decarboxylase family protein [Amycolatopsis acidicola]
MTDETRQRGLDMMSKVYGWDMPDRPGEFFRYTLDHLFADIWTRPGLEMRDRRLMLLGLLAAQGIEDLAEVQVTAALKNGELTEDQLREIAVFLTHYVGWPLGTKLYMTVEKVIARRKKEAKE